MQSFPNCGPRTINSSRARARDPQLVPGIRLNRFLGWFFTHTNSSASSSATSHFLGSVFPYTSDLHFVSQRPNTSFSGLYQLGILYGPNGKTKCLALSLQEGRWKAELQLPIPAIVCPADGNSQVFRLQENISLGLWEPSCWN